ncbi:MAG: protein kinase [Myxococcota bacterium]|nr:protein kinase [Myxococcota bacterium]
MASNTEQLKDLAALLERGLVSREEFEQEKARLLGAADADRSGGSDGSGTDPTWAQAGPAPEARPAASQPERVGAYKVIDPLGKGGMGTVYRARHRSPAIAERQGGDVALKVLHPRYLQEPSFLERFEREAELGTRLEHPGVVRTLDLVVDGEERGIVMELVEGEPLSRRIGHRAGAVEWSEAISILRPVLDAVGYAHSRGVIHRDLKPDNIMVSPSGMPLVMDFGIAKSIESDHTRTGTGLGTVKYMAPEQYTDAKGVDHRADLYALGITLYEMVAGRMPWERGTTAYSIMALKADGDLPPPSEYCPILPTQVVELIESLTAVSPHDRPGSAAEVAEEFDRLLGQVPGAATLVPATEPDHDDPTWEEPLPEQERPQPHVGPWEPGQPVGTIAEVDPGSGGPPTLPRSEPREPESTETPPPSRGGVGRWIMVGLVLVLTVATAAWWITTPSSTSDPIESQQVGSAEVAVEASAPPDPEVSPEETPTPDPVEEEPEVTPGEEEVEDPGTESGVSPPPSRTAPRPPDRMRSGHNSRQEPGRSPAPRRPRR